MTDVPTQTFTSAQAIELYPCLKGLALLPDAGWKFLPLRGVANIMALEGFKRWPHGWRDCIRVREETDALGIRIRVPADRHTNPEIVWEYSGTLAEVVERLMTLPAPDTRLAPQLVVGNAPALWTP